MIPKGLKIGDTFNDFGLTYKVTKVDGERYESVRVDNPPLTPSITSYNDMPYAQLKKICSEKGISAKGSKEELIARLEG